MPGLGATDVRIRMYRVGFGDCFLLSVPGSGGHRHVLVDFGVHPAGQITGVLDQVMADLETTTGRVLDLLIATHEHADHISGFGAYKDRFARFQIGAVFMPWALDPEDRTAIAMRRKRMALVDTLAAHLAATGGDPRAAAALVNMSAANNEPAVRALRAGFGVTTDVRYFAAGDAARLPATLAGVSARVLGPPTDRELLKKMDPPASERYLRAGPGGTPQFANELRPFGDKWRIDAEAGRALFRFTAREEKDLASQLEGGAARLAFALDSAINNTSLVLLFSVRGRTLLFPGDAQWGNWKSWLDGDSSDSVLEGVSFLKVAHHGSLNATPKSALERMTTGGFAAMASTQTKPWPSIPRIPLMTALSRKTRRHVLRSDQLRAAGGPEGPRLPTRLPTGFSRGGSLWLDYTIRT
jgi:hypothetical protein